MLALCVASFDCLVEFGCVDPLFVRLLGGFGLGWRSLVFICWSLFVRVSGFNGVVLMFLTVDL